MSVSPHLHTIFQPFSEISKNMTIRIGIIDDHPTIVYGVQTALATADDLHVVAHGADVPELLARERNLHVVLLDLSLADGSSPAENLHALARGTSARVVVFSTGDRPVLIREASQNGALGMIRKSAPSLELIDAIRAAAHGEVVASADWASALSYDAQLHAALSPREIEVLALYASGETAERVGRELYISRETVIDHIRRIRSKYASLQRPANNKIQLYQRAVEDGIIDTA